MRLATKGRAALSALGESADDTGSSDQDLLCLDSPLGNVDTYLSVDLPAWVTSHLRVDTRAYELAVRHPALLPAFLDFSGEKQPMRDTKQNAADEVFDGDTTAYGRQDPLAGTMGPVRR
jgi:hypothetical protein